MIVLREFRLTALNAAPFAGLVLLAAFGLIYAVGQPFSAPGPPFADFGAYYAAGGVWRDGGDPFSTAVGAIERLLPNASPNSAAIMPYVGPPIGLPLWAAFARLPYAAATTIWAVLSVVCAAIVLAVPAILAGRRLRRIDAIALLLFGAAGPLVYGIALGQAALPAIAAIALALVFVQRKQWSAVAAAACVAAAFKPNIALVLVATLRGAGALVAYATAGVAALLGNVGLGGGITGLQHYLATLGGQSAAERFYAFQFTPTAIAFGFGASPAAAIAIGAIISFGVLFACIAAIRWSRARSAEGALIACAAWPLATPFVHQPDLAIALLPGIYAIYRARGRAWLIGAIGCAIVTVNAFTLVEGPFGGIFAVISATVAALQITVLGSGVGPRLRFAPLIASAGFAVLALAAPAMPLPMWPDALPRGFAASLSAPAHVVWHLELVASHLEVPLPWVALVRTVTLAGCVAIGIAATCAMRRAFHDDEQGNSQGSSSGARSAARSGPPIRA